MSNDWIEHNGGPQPVGDDDWLEVLFPGTASGWMARAGNRMALTWKGQRFKWRFVNDHLIDAKQAEIDALRDDLETWQSVFPHVMPDRLKSDQQLADEDKAAKIDAARLEGIRLGLEAAAKAADAQAKGWRGHALVAAQALYQHRNNLRNLNPDTIAQEAQHD